MSTNRQYKYEKNLRASDYQYGPPKGQLEIQSENTQNMQKALAALLYILVEKQWLTLEQADGVSKGFSGSPREWEDSNAG